MKDPKAPPTGKIRWAATSIKREGFNAEGEWVESTLPKPQRCVVKAQTWHQARALAMVKLQCEPWELEVTSKEL
jgi:hypothetical protein